MFPRELPPPQNDNSPWKFAAGRNFSKKSYFAFRIYIFVPDAVPGRQISSLQPSSYHIAGLEDGTSDGSAL